MKTIIRVIVVIVSLAVGATIGMTLSKAVDNGDYIYAIMAVTALAIIIVLTMLGKRP